MTLLRQILRAVLRPLPMAIVFAWAMKRKLVLLSDSRDPDALTVLAFDPDRWTQDLLALAKVAHLRIYAVPFAVSTRIHNLFFGSDPMPGTDDYFHVTDPRTLAKRQAQARYASAVLRHLKRWLNLDCAANPAIHYIVDFPWVQGGEAAGVPFVTAHKEFTVLDDRQVEGRIVVWRDRRFKFLGTRLAVTNAIAEKLFVESGITPASKVSRAGLLRFDNLLRNPAPAAPRDPVTVTLFSFGHLTGPFDSKAEPHGHYFTKHDDDGFVELFNDTHVAFAQAARAHPNAQFLIKPKNVERWWIEKIEQAVEEGLGVPLSSIRNCRVVADPAPDLIRRSVAAIGLNSTVVLETVALDRDLIMPVFAEAAGKYADKVYFPQFRDVFSVANSRAELSAMLERVLRGERLKKPAPERLHAMFDEYVGNHDGRSAERLAAILHDVVRGRTVAQIDAAPVVEKAAGRAAA
jgi:hypothetical protein